jgi:hypothetical protein
MFYFHFSKPNMQEWQMLSYQKLAQTDSKSMACQKGKLIIANPELFLIL